MIASKNDFVDVRTNIHALAVRVCACMFVRTFVRALQFTGPALGDLTV